MWNIHFSLNIQGLETQRYKVTFPKSQTLARSRPK